jgi:threonine dehydratase
MESARDVVAPHLRRTPVMEIPGSDLGLGDCTLLLKLEYLQHTGSFKARGALANLLLREVPEAGVVAASGGNHGVATAYAAMRLGVRAKVFVPTISSPAKIARIRGYGADLVVTGDRYDDARAASEEWAAGSGAMRVHPFDQRETLLGVSTLGAELQEQAPAADTVLVAVGGGGLIGGIASSYAGGTGGGVSIVGVEPEGAPTLTRALAAGEPVDAETGSIAADSLAPKRVGTLMFPIAQKHVSRVVLVPDEAIADAQRKLWDVLRIVAEPGGATALSALLSGRYVPLAGERIVVLVCGANTDAVSL